ncbi:phage tail tape measure protein [Bifidobacterium reuteri]|uniref:Phage tail tape measure protein n=1 Tax=Bifidobacterium reuteri TaxID=983706 RepID=A0A5J5ECF9_9BIFI|nr:tape measure protein [Bifidobacterium reuteri]KAA8826840.1 phage tail tape measure protein [Bifidobacterium reuteri]
MAIEIATAFVQIVPSMKGVGKAIESAFGSASQSAGEQGGRQAGTGFASGFGAKLGVITGIAQSVAGKAIDAFMGLSGEITSASDSAQKFASTLDFAGVSEQQIRKLTASTQDYADKTVYDLNDIRNTTAQLAANGVPNYDRLAEAAGNLNAVAGGSADTFKSVAMVLTQTAGQGKLTTENWNQLSDAIPGASGKIQQALQQAGAYTGNFRDAMSDGEITAQEFNDAIMSLGFTDAAVEAATSAATIEGATGNLEAAFVKLGSSILDSVKPAITGGMSWIADGVTNAVPVVQAGIQGVINWFQRLYAKLEENGAITAFKSAWNTIRDAIMGVVNMVIDWAHMIPPDGVANAIKLVADLLNLIVNNAGKLAPVLIPAVTAFLGFKTATAGITAINNGLNGVFRAAVNVKNAAGTVTDAINGIGGVSGKIKQLAASTNIAKNAQLAWSAVTQAGTAVARAFNAVLKANPAVFWITVFTAVAAALIWFFTQTEFGRKMWAAFTSWLSETWTALVEGAKALWNGLGEFFANLWATITGGVRSAWDGIGDFLTGLWETISGGVTSAWNAITTFLTGVWTGISTTVTTIFNGIRDFIVNVFTVIGALIVAPLQAIQNGINTVFGWILSFITQQMNSTNTVWSTIWTAIYNVVNTIFTLIRGYISTVVNAIRTVIVVFLSLLKGDWQGAWDAIKSFFTTTWDGIKSFLSNTLDAIKNVWTSVWTAVSQFFTNVWNRIVAFFAPIINGIRNTISTVLNAIKSVWTSVWNAVSSFISGVWNGISSVVSTYINNVRNTISTVLNAIRSVWTNVWNSVSSFLGGIWNGITSAVSNGIQNVSETVGRIRDTVLGAVSNAGSWLYDAGRDIIQGLINGIGGAFQWVRNTISNLGSSLVGWAKNVLGIHSPSRIFRDEVGKWIPAGMAQGIDKASNLVEDSIDSLTGMVPTVSLKTDMSRLETPLAYQNTVSGGRVGYTMDDRSAEYATKQDIIDAIDQALSSGITLNLNDRGGEVMAGKLAKPMSYELNSLAMRGR